MKQNQIILIVGLMMIGGTAWGIKEMSAHQRLGNPGIRTSLITNSERLDIYMPERVLDYQSKAIPTAKTVIDTLPHDTSFGTRVYERAPLDWVVMNVVLMGTDRTSIHKPEFCLTGQGWNIDNVDSTFDTVRVERPQPYDLQIKKMVCAREVKDASGNTIPQHCIFVYWFVADHDLTASHWARIGKMSTHLLTTGELERWAYVYCMTVCPPGGEDQAYGRIKKFIADAVPQFQLAAGPPGAELAASRTASSH